MKILTIKQKMSGTGSIHDLASDWHDREIKFPEGSKFAVVRASYYGGKGYTTHRTGGAAIAESKRMSEYSHEILDVEGNCFRINYDTLFKY